MEIDSSDLHSNLLGLDDDEVEQIGLIQKEETKEYERIKLNVDNKIGGIESNINQCIPNQYMEQQIITQPQVGGTINCGYCKALLSYPSTAIVVLCPLCNAYTATQPLLEKSNGEASGQPYMEKSVRWHSSEYKEIEEEKLKLSVKSCAINDTQKLQEVRGEFVKDREKLFEEIQSKNESKITINTERKTIGESKCRNLKFNFDPEHGRHEQRFTTNKIHTSKYTVLNFLP